MKKVLIVFLLLLRTAFAQEIDLDIHHNNLKEYIKREEASGGKKIQNNSDYVSFTGEAQPILYLHKQKNIPDLISYYFFKKRDSTMSYILHEWDVYNFEKIENNKKPLEFEKALISKYNALEKSITKLYGQSVVTGDLTELDKTATEAGLTKKNVWKPNDITEIEMYTSISNFYRKNGMFTTNPTHRIRLYIRNTKKDEPGIPKVDPLKADSLNAVAEKFWSLLRFKDISGCRKYLSDIIVNQVTDDQLNSLRSSIKFDDGLELYFTGAQAGIDGSVFNVLQYKYSTNTSSIINEFVKVIFDDKNKIIGIQPMRLQSIQKMN